MAALPIVFPLVLWQLGSFIPNGEGVACEAGHDVLPLFIRSVWNEATETIVSDADPDAEVARVVKTPRFTQAPSFPHHPMSNVPRFRHNAHTVHRSPTLHGNTHVGHVHCLDLVLGKYPQRN